MLRLHRPADIRTVQELLADADVSTTMIHLHVLVLNERNARFGQPEQDTNQAYAPRMLQLGFRIAF